MKKNILTFILFFSTQILLACCAGEMISIVPKSTEIQQNPIILIDFMESDYKIYKNLENARFYLVDDKGNKTVLEVLERNMGFNTWAQILLRPTRKLITGRKVSLNITGLSPSGELHQKFLRTIQSKNWEVRDSTDQASPRFYKDISLEYVNQLNSSAAGHGVKGVIKFEGQQTIENQIIIEATDSAGNRYLIATIGHIFWIYSGICGSIFELNQDTEYHFKVRLMDLSGNVSDETMVLNFKTGNSNKI